MSSRFALLAALAICLTSTGTVLAEPGLLTEWHDGTGDVGIGGIDAFFAPDPVPSFPIFVMNNNLETPSGPNFNENDPAVGLPTQVTANGGNQTVRWTGQIFIPMSGTYNFKDGIDQTTRLRIDGQEIIADSAWTDFNGTGGNGSQISPANFNVAPGGEWLDFEFVMSESCCGDQSALYWDYDQTLGLNANVAFPANDGDPAGLGALIPGSQFRTEPVAIPEPATLAIWSVLGLIGAAYGWRRLRKS